MARFNVLGNARTKSLGGYSLSFRLPSLDRKFTHQTIHERHRTSLWRLCRGCLGTEDTFLYHADCFHAVERRYGRRLGIEDLWTIGLWTQGLPRMPAVSTARPQMMARMDVDTEAGTTDADSWLCGIGRLPQELLDQIYDLCPESLLWRYSSALGRMPLLEPLLDRNGDTVRQSLGDLGSWNRWGVTEATSGPSKFVRLSIDDLGIRAVEQLPATPSEPITQGAGVWYTVEPVGSFKDYQCEAKGGFLRLIPPGDSQRTDTGMTLWDTPSPPPTERIAWFSNRCGTSRICCVNLQGLRGLTAFCSKGAIYAIRPHYKWGITPALAPSQGNLPPSERKKLTPIYFPLANGETITEVWIVTSTGRFQLFGRYISPLRGADNPHLGLRWRRIGDATTTHLLYTDTMFQTPHTDLGAASSMDRTLPPQKQPGPPAILTECRGWAIAAHFGYMSVASLRRVTQLKLFQNKWPGVVPTEIPCRGMLLGYEDGSLAALGDCSGYEAAAAEQQVEEDVFHDPWALHHRTIPGTGRVVLRCGSLTDSKEPDLDYRSWSLSAAVYNAIPAHAPPAVNMFALWADADAGVLYRYGGEKSYGANVSDENQHLWKFTPDEAGGGNWAVQAGFGVYIGGFGDRSTDPRFANVTWPNSTPIAGMVTFNATTRTWSHEQVLDSDSKSNTKGKFTTGQAQCVTGFGSNPIVVALGGWYTDFQTISMYDPVKRRWFLQQAQGSVPRARENFCAVGVKSPQGTFDIFIHGGSNPADGTLSDTFVLSIPSFTWFKVGVTMPMRMDHACAVIGGRQMLVSGGLAVQWDWKTNDEWAGAHMILDLAAWELSDRYDSDAAEYRPAQAIKNWYNSGLVYASTYCDSGMANVQWENDEVRSIFNVNVNMNRSSTATATSSPTPSATSSSSPSAAKSPAAGTIAGSVVGGVAAVLIVGTAAFVFRRYRRRRPKLYHQGGGPVELIDEHVG
ncbi:hypothetical protein O9K51_06759 [Purpureocillium lavendulum]|uniref:Kelch repeat protein n=1 Tax=Purpureocillium lavendulum TaxID=1247861 RepID=A0AB34FRK2_9HYPO|nr:hypothetical protein O9K51_06759 [Purpureocillium lavendulum]